MDNSVWVTGEKSVDQGWEMDYKFLPLSSSKTGFEHGTKKTRGSTMQKEYESYRIDFR